jgi:TPR repeat protein
MIKEGQTIRAVALSSLIVLSSHFAAIASEQPCAVDILTTRAAVDNLHACLQVVENFRKAADQGNAEAQYSLGIVILQGYYVSRDESAGAALVMKAAEQGFAPAQNMIGRLYEKGRGVPHDEDQADLWYSKAAMNGNAEAMAALKDRKLTSQGSAIGAAIIGLGLGTIAAGIAADIAADSNPSSSAAPKTSEYDRQLQQNEHNRNERNFQDNMRRLNEKAQQDRQRPWHQW